MNIHLISVGNKMPSWVSDGYLEYAKRLPAECTLKLTEIAPGRRGQRVDVARTLRDEGERMLKSVPKGCRLLALDVGGRQWSSEQLAVQLNDWMAQGSDVALLVGGPDGLAPECLASSDMTWSLSALTYPHALVRIILAEQLYRAWSINAGHPYHRS